MTFKCVNIRRKIMKKLTRLIAIVFAVTMCASLTACGPTGESNATVVNIMNNGGGCGRIWLDNAIARFQKKIGDKSYADGKQGVKFEIEHNINTSTGTMGTFRLRYIFYHVRRVSA